MGTSLRFTGCTKLPDLRLLSHVKLVAVCDDVSSPYLVEISLMQSSSELQQKRQMQYPLTEGNGAPKLIDFQTSAALPARLARESDLGDRLLYQLAQHTC